MSLSDVLWLLAIMAVAALTAVIVGVLVELMRVAFDSKRRSIVFSRPLMENIRRAFTSRAHA